MKNKNLFLLLMLFFLLGFIVNHSFIFVQISFADTKKEEKVTFNFVEVDLPMVTKFISEITGKNFIFDDRIKGKITIIAPSKLSVSDAFNLFTSVLELKGFTVVPSGIDAYKIIPTSEAKQKGVKVSMSSEQRPVNEGYIARLISLKNISSEDAIKLLQPIVSRDGYISSFGPGNLLLLVDSGLNIEKVLNIVESIDQPSLKEDADIVFLKFANADSVAKILNEGVGHSKIKGMVGQQAQTEAAKSVADQRLNAVILFGDRKIKESMKSLIAAIDVSSPGERGRINVYFLENADATELAKVMEGIIRSAQPQKQPVVGAAPATPFETVSGITIAADKATNSLIIVASPADYQSLLHIIKQLDKRRRQVFVEAMIAEVSIDELRELGVKWRATVKHNGEPVFIGGFGNIGTSSIESIIYGLNGLTMGGMGNFLDIPITTIDPSTGAVSTSTLTVPGFAALFNLNEFKGAVNVLSTPQLLTSDNKEAEIVVGENVPFISKRERDITTTNTVLSSIERQDVGIKLKITPQITEGDYVKLDIYQEISSVKQEADSSILINVGPTTTKRSTKTSVVVKDRQTVIIGGLIQEKDEENLTKIPLLGDIPLLGWLFKNKSVAKKKTNLLVFLTPHVVKDAEGLGRITGDKRMEFVKKEKHYVEGELLVKFKEGINNEKAADIISKKGATLIKYTEQLKVYHIRLRKGQDVEDAISEFSSMPEIEYAEPNYKIKVK
ncbi:MAG: type II secretion system secretin GspD [Thermodesulfovibrionales bacterium]|nr:type II secretion system secretin GspD [Thermodesulfovibrionales bacterium]